MPQRALKPIRLSPQLVVIPVIRCTQPIKLYSTDKVVLNRRHNERP